MEPKFILFYSLTEFDRKFGGRRLQTFLNDIYVVLRGYFPRELCIRLLPTRRYYDDIVHYGIQNARLMKTLYLSTYTIKRMLDQRKVDGFVIRKVSRIPGIPKDWKVGCLGCGCNTYYRKGKYWLENCKGAKVEVERTICFCWSFYRIK